MNEIIIVELTPDEAFWLVGLLSQEQRLAVYQSKRPDTIGHMASRFVPAKKHSKSILAKVRKAQKQL